jgi:hypothetical protein
VESFIRSKGEDKLLVLHNLSGDTQTVTLQTDEDLPTFASVLFVSGEEWEFADGTVELPPYSSMILK